MLRLSKSWRARDSHPVPPRPRRRRGPEQVFRWRDSVAEKDDTSQAEWLAKQGQRGAGHRDGRRARAPLCGRAGASLRRLARRHGLSPDRAADRRLPAELGHWGASTTATPCPRPSRSSAAERSAASCRRRTLASARRSRWSGSEHLLPRVDTEAADILAGALGGKASTSCTARRPHVGRRRGRPFRVELEDREPIAAERLLVATGRRPNVEGFGLETLDLRIGKRDRGRRPTRRRRRRLGRRRRDRRRPSRTSASTRGGSRRRTWRRGTRAPTTARSRRPPIRRSRRSATRARGRGHLVPKRV